MAGGSVVVWRGDGAVVGSGDWVVDVMWLLQKGRRWVMSVTGKGHDWRTPASVVTKPAHERKRYWDLFRQISGKGKGHRLE